MSNEFGVGHEQRSKSGRPHRALLADRPPDVYAALQHDGSRHMKLIVGLGNPGPKYARNRHNIGFIVLDQIARDHGFPDWRGKHQGSVSEGRFGSDRVVRRCKPPILPSSL
jgi:hypothetical protein